MAKRSRHRLGEQQRQIDRLVAEIERLKSELSRLDSENKRLKSENERLRQELEKTQRAGKRQAAPFSKGDPKPDPKKPGRKKGARYGKKGHRAQPKKIDEVHEAPLPHACPHCQGKLKQTGIAPQYQVDIPRKPIHRQFNIHVGHCQSCGKRVQGRHPLQTSDALGAAASQLGPEAQAAAVFLNKQLGVSHAKVSRCFRDLFGIDLSPGGVTHSILRAGRRLEPAYHSILESIRGSPFTVPDETGWKVGGQKAWAHVFVTKEATCFVIDPTRSLAPAEKVLGLDYDGVLIHDGWSVYDHFVDAAHQQCLAHPMRRCDELLHTAVGGAVHFPRAIVDVFAAALATRDRYLAGELSEHGLAVRRGQLETELGRLVLPVKTHADNERLAQHLHAHFGEWFLFLYQPGLDATNWRAEQALRVLIVNRKVWGGNRTWAGAHAQQVLSSTLATCRQQGHNPIHFVAQTLQGHSTAIVGN